MEIELASTGISKGLAQTDGPQLELIGGVSLGAFLLEAYGKNVETSGDAGVETGASVGVEHETGGLELSARVGLKTLADMASPDRTAFEAEVEASRSFGPVRVSASTIFSPDDTGSTGQALFVEAGIDWEVADGVTIGAALGRRERDASPDYTAFNVAASYEPVPDVTLDMRYFTTDRSDEGGQFRPGLVAAVRARF